MIYPGLAGGANWSGAAYDPKSGWLFVPTNNFGVTLRLKKLPEQNFFHTDDVILHSGWRALHWLFHGTGTGLRYHAVERELFAVSGIPCNAPPWGTLSAVDLNRGEIVWQVPAGQTKQGVPGSRNFGAPLVTAGGLVFLGGGEDPALYVYDAQSGAVLRRIKLPAGLHAGPMTYKLDSGGKQYLVVTPGGYAGLSKLGDYVMAFTLED